MKNFCLIVLFLLVESSNLFCLPGEYWFLIHDENINGYNYIVVARRLSLEDPLFGVNFMEVNSSDYNYVLSIDDRLTGPIDPPYNIRRGFDFLYDQSNFAWPSRAVTNHFVTEDSTANVQSLHMMSGFMTSSVKS